MNAEHFETNDEDPIYNIGDQIVNKIIDSFSLNASRNKEFAEMISIEYAQYTKTLLLYEDITGTEIQEYVVWSRAMSDAVDGNWTQMQRILNNLGNDFVTGENHKIQDEEFGTSLINLSRSL
ncbi:MAG TPA: hypothetical protein VKC53_01310 [Patescibacteria group bacterium]|nr:hypothetical protein [Patescibacteria group bacterium]